MQQPSAHTTALMPSLALNPDPDNLPPLDPKDRFLLGDPSANSTPYTNGAAPASASGASTPLPAHVPWLRKTEYLSREGVQRASSIQDMYSLSLSCVFCAFANSFCDRKPLPQHIDVSRSAQLRDIDASFAACNDPSQFDLSTLRHPNKQNITAVESFEIYPDADIWANAYDLFRFSERPGEKPIDVSRGCPFSTIMFLIALNAGGRSPAGLCYFATHGVRRRPLLVLLPYQRRRSCDRVQGTTYKWCTPGTGGGA